MSVDTPSRRLDLIACRVDLRARVARWPDGDRSLTPTEAKLLAYLAGQAGRAVSRDELLEQVWGYRSGVVTRTVKTTMGRLRGKVERDPSCPDHLVTAVGVGYRFEAGTAEQISQVREELSTHADAPAPLPRAARVSLPAAVELLGRQDDLERLLTLAAQRRLVTLVGPGGVGKTSLAVAAATRLAEGEEWREAAFCDLGAAETVEDLVRALADALGARPPAGTAQEGLAWSASLLRGRGRLLLIFDNAEPIVDALADALEGWLAAAPQLHAVVTSREALRLADERTLSLDTLDEDAGRRLFRRRADDALPGYDVDAQLTPIVRLVDGLPLALEMAASWASMLPPDELARRLDRQLDLLADDRRGRPARQASLRATVSSSWELLQEWERSATAQIAAFAGPFAAEAAEAVLDLRAHPAAPPALPALRQLARRSLIRTESSGSGPVRFALFRAVRDFAWTQGADRDAEQRHGLWFARWGGSARRAEVERRGGEALDALLRDRDDLVMAGLRAVHRGDADVAVGAALGLDALVRAAGPARGHSGLLEAALRLPGLDSAARAALQLCQAGQRMAEGATAAADATLAMLDAGASPAIAEEAALRSAELLIEVDPESAAERLRQLADGGSLGARLGLAQALVAAGEHEAARHVAEQALTLAREGAAPVLEAGALTLLARIAEERGRPLRARSLLEAARDLQRQAGHHLAEAEVEERLGLLALACDERDEARRRLTAALDGFREQGAHAGTARALEARGRVELAEGRLEQAGPWLQEAHEIARALDAPLAEASVLACLAERELLLGRLPSARGHVQRALTKVGRVSQPRLAAALLQVRAELEAGEGDLERARQSFGKARSLLEDLGQRVELIELLERWAALEAAAGREADAARLLTEADAAAELSVADGPVRASSIWLEPS